MFVVNCLSSGSNAACINARRAVLHPHFKTREFEESNWSADRIEEIERQARDTLDRDYPTVVSQSVAPKASSSAKNTKNKTGRGSVSKGVRGQSLILYVTNSTQIIV